VLAGRTESRSFKKDQNSIQSRFCCLLYNFVITMLHAFMYLCERFQMKCSIASDVLTSLAPLLSVHNSAVLSCMTLLCPKICSSCLNSLWKKQTFKVWCSFVTKALSSKYVYSLETINIICFQALSPTPKLSATNSAWFMSASLFKRFSNDFTEIFSSLKCFGFKL